MRWVLPLLFGAVLAGTAAWVLLADGRGSGDAAEAAAHDDHEERGGPALVGSTRSSAAAGTPAADARCVLTGRVTRAGSAARASVEVRRTANPYGRDAAGWARVYYDARLRTPAQAASGAARTAETDAQGEFRVEGLEAGVYDVAARDGEGARAHRVVGLGAPGVRVAVVLPLQAAGATLRGRAHFTDGAPVAGRVAVWAPLEPGTDTWEVTPTAGATESEIGTDGTLTVMGLVPGRYVVRLYLPDGGVAFAPVAVVPSADLHEVLVPRLGGTVAGRVQSEPGGDPVVGALVVSTGRTATGECTLAYRATTDGDGRFRLPGAERDASLVVAAAGFGSRTFDVPHPGEDLVLRLPLPGRLEGRVRVRADGRPAPGARVVAVDRSGDAKDVDAVADADGRYAFPSLPAGQRTIVVLGGGWASPGLGTEPEHRRQQAFELEVPAGVRVVHDLVVEPSVRLEGTVRGAGGEAVEGVSVRVGALLRGDDEDWELHGLLAPSTVASAADGGFAFADLPADAVARLAAWRPGEAPGIVEVPLAAPGPVRQDVRLVHGTWLDVRVVGQEDGAPVAGALVRVLIDDLPGGSEVEAPTLTGSDGRARLGPVGEGEHQVTAHLANVQATEHLAVGSGRSQDVEVALRRGHALRGTVVRADGAPARGVRVSVQAVDAGVSCHVSTVTGVDGAFRFDALSAGRWLAEAGDGDLESETVAVDAGSAGVVLRLPAAPPPAPDHTVRLRVLDPAGRPVPSFELRAGTSGDLRGQRDGWEGRAEVSTETEGDPVPPTLVEVYGARGGDGQPLDLGPAQVTLAPGGGREVEVRLAPGSSIEGRTLFADGRPAFGTRVRAWAVGTAAQGAASLPFEGIEVRARADAEGRFRLVGLADGLYRLGVDPPPGGAAPQVLPEVRAGTRDVEVRLGAGVSARLRIVAWDGRPLPSASVWVLVDGHWDGAHADEQGCVLFRDLPTEIPIRLDVNPPDDVEDALPLEVEPWRPADGEIRLARARVLAGHVRAPSGAPVERARVARLDAEGDVADSVFTDAEGAFRLVGVPSGTARLHVWPPRVGSWVPERRVAASFEAGRENAVVVVEPFPVVRVRLSPAPAEDERRARGQLVWSCDDEVRQIDVEESAQCGVYLLPGLQPGQRYGFWLRRGAQHALVELDGSATEATATFREGRTIRGRILGFPLGEQVWVRATGPLGISESAYTDREGQFGFVGLPPGRWSLRAFVDERVARAEVESGGTVDLLLEPPER